MKAQTAIEYLLLVGVGVVLVTMLAYFVKLVANRW